MHKVINYAFNIYKYTKYSLPIFVSDAYPVADMKYVGVTRSAPVTQGHGHCDGYCPGFGSEPYASRKSYNQISNYGCQLRLLVLHGS
jgi:hypothetical protein